MKEPWMPPSYAVTLVANTYGKLKKRINPVIMDIHNSIMDIRNSIMDIHNSIMDVHNSIMDNC